MNLLILTARGLRADALGAYGNSWTETPALDLLASQGVVFDRHFADVADETGARGAWRTGNYHFGGLLSSNNASSHDLIAHLRQHGVKTCLIVDASHPYPTTFAEGWDEVIEVNTGGEESALECALDRARSLLKKWKNREPWLLWIDIATLLPPWEVPTEFQDHYFHEDIAEVREQEEVDDDPYDAIEVVEELDDEPKEPLTPFSNPALGPIDSKDDTLYLRLQNSYAAALSYVDAAVGELLESIEELGLSKKTAVLLTSDCGFALGEHGVVGPVPPSLHAEAVHLPLIIRMPEPSLIQRVDLLTQAIDLAPTIAALLAQPLTTCNGKSLVSLIQGETKAVRSHAISGIVKDGVKDWAIRTPEWAYILLSASDDSKRIAQLYVKPDDRWEVNNVLHHHTEVAEQLEREMRRFIDV